MKSSKVISSSSKPETMIGCSSAYAVDTDVVDYSGGDRLRTGNSIISLHKMQKSLHKMQKSLHKMQDKSA
jgi:hypothetical protein